MEMGRWDGGWRKGPWTPQEDKLLIQYVTQYGEGRWSSVSACTGLKRSGKSSRLRWVNYLRPGLKKGQLTPQEEGIIIELHAIWGNKWSTIARYLPGRTDNEIKNYWRTHFNTRRAKGPTAHNKQGLSQIKKPCLVQTTTTDIHSIDHGFSQVTSMPPCGTAADCQMMSTTLQETADTTVVHASDCELEDRIHQILQELMSDDQLFSCDEFSHGMMWNSDRDQNQGCCFNALDCDAGGYVYSRNTFNLHGCFH